MKKNLSRLATWGIGTPLLLAGILLSAGIALAAWTAPTGGQLPAPGTNVPGPITVGVNTSSTQTLNGTLGASFSLTSDGGIWAYKTNSALSFIVTAAGVGIGNISPGQKLDVTGTVQATAFIYSSDRRLKENIKPLSSALSNVRKLQGVSFDWKEDGTNSLGLIAQDVQLVYPQLVSTNSSTGLLSVAYGNLVAPIVEAIKELANRSDSQAAAITALQEKVASQEAEIQNLKAAVDALKK